MSGMRFIVVGCGLLGITTAYFLRERGHEVVVLDREKGPGLGTSFANGSILTPSMADPWNAPGCWRVLLASLGRSDAPMQLRLKALPGLIQWGLTFLRNSSPSAFEANTLKNLRLAQFSLEVMQALRERLPLKYRHAADGTLRIFRNRSALEKAAGTAREFQERGVHSRVLNVSELVALEPDLRPLAGSLAGAIHYSGDEVGDARLFCASLADIAAREGVEFRFDVEVRSLQTHGRGVASLVTSSGQVTADRYVIAAGSYSSSLLRAAGIALPVRPVKGYSITVTPAEGQRPLRLPVVDDDLHAVVTPLGEVLRVAGTAEFAGFDHELRAERIRNLVGLLRAVLPEFQFDAAQAQAQAWCGFRPMSADGVPIIGRTPLGNLFLNTGHGHLGWTMAAGSGKALASVVSGVTPDFDITPYELARFA